MLSKTFAVATTAAALLSAHQASAQALAEPPAGKVILGIWPQSDPGYQETPSQLNQIYGFNFGSFQLSQPIPVPAYDYVTGVGGPAPVALIEATGTDADVFLTVYPQLGLAAVTDADLLSLAVQCRIIHNGGRTVFLRFAPEFNGNWMIYGLQPVEFKAVWARMYSIIKAEAPDTVVVFSPNIGYSYPFGATLASVPNAADQAALDTNGDGQLTGADDPYSPWYPGDDQVDWNGISMYFKGPDFLNINVNQAPGFTQALLTGHNPFYPQRGQVQVNWYQMYCTQKPSKACAFSEAAASWHSASSLVASATNTQAQLQSAWTANALLNATFWEEYPRMKGYWHFEHFKVETDGGITDPRDYRISNDTATLAAFKAAILPVGGMFVLGNSTLQLGQAINTSIFEITPSGPIATATATVSLSAITATYTQFYSGPLVNASSVGTADPLASATAISTVAGIPGRGNAGAAAPTQAVNGNVFKGAATSAHALSATVLFSVAAAVFALLN